MEEIYMGSYGAPWDERMMAEWLSHDPEAAMREMRRITMEEAAGKAPWQLALAARAAKQGKRRKRPAQSKKKALFSGHRPSNVDMKKLIRRQQKEIALMTQALLEILKKQPELVLHNKSVRKLILSRFGPALQKRNVNT